MEGNRRSFLKRMGVASLGVGFAGSVGQRAYASESGAPSDEWMGVLVDIPQCVGCRKCEYACQEAAGFEVAPIETFEDKSVFSVHRRPQPRTYTTVNEFPNPKDENKPIYVKANCLHCNEPACVSACLVRALQKESDGSVVYDAWKCMGCRYCMVACPHQIPAYEYDNALTPQVRKCTFCFDNMERSGGVPACVKICPPECLIYGKRSDLLTLAREKIQSQPGTYVDHIYGEHEVGGSSWLYLSGVPFEDIGFVKLGATVPSKLTEMIQHGVFSHWMPPLALFGLLGAVMWLARPDPPDVQDVGAGEASGDAGSVEPAATPVQVGAAS